MKNENIHLVKAAFHAQFRRAMEIRGIAADYYFKKFNLPTEVGDPESLLPLKPFFHLINIVAINENMPDFGTFVAQTTPWHKVLSLGPLIENSENLNSLLQTFCDIARSQSSLVKFTLVDEGSHFDFCYIDNHVYKGDNPLYKGDTRKNSFKYSRNYRCRCLFIFYKKRNPFFTNGSSYFYTG